MTATWVALLAVAAAPLSFDFRGTLGEALNQIATKGEINLIATGDLHVPAEVHLKSVTAEEAIHALVKVHGLSLHKEGKLWVVKPPSNPQAIEGTVAGELEVPVPVVVATPTPPAPPQKPELGADPALPGLESGTAAKLRAEAKAHERAAAEAERRADALRDEADRILEAKEEAEEARREAEEARLEEARAAVEQAKAKAHSELSSGSKTVATGPVTVAAGEVVDDVVSYGGPVTLSDGVVANGNVVAFGGDVVLGDGVVVNGDAVSFGGRVNKGVGTVVNGEEVSFGASGFGVKPMIKALPTTHAAAKTEEKHGLGAFLVNFATFFALGFLLMMFVPNRMRNIEAEIRAEPVKSGLAGLLGILGAVPLTLLLLVTVVGIPVAAVMWFLGGLSIVMGMLALANLVGSRFPVAKLRRTQAAVLAVGLLSMMLVAVIPVLGPLVLFGALCVSFGAIIRTRVGQRPVGLPIPEAGLHQVQG